MEKNCSKCEERKPEEEFAFKSKVKGTRQSVCKVCHRVLMREHYVNNKQYYVDKAKRYDEGVLVINRKNIIEYLRDHPCVDCGNADVEVLQFDHVDATKKSFAVSRMLQTHSWASIMREVEKCQVRCSNCHIRRTRRQFGFWTDDN